MCPGLSWTWEIQHLSYVTSVWKSICHPLCVWDALPHAWTLWATYLGFLPLPFLPPPILETSEFLLVQNIIFLKSTIYQGSNFTCPCFIFNEWKTAISSCSLKRQTRAGCGRTTCKPWRKDVIRAGEANARLWREQQFPLRFMY